VSPHVGSLLKGATAHESLRTTAPGSAKEGWDEYVEASFSCRARRGWRIFPTCPSVPRA